jgi:plastocyanin
MPAFRRTLSFLLAAFAILIAVPSFALAHGAPHPVHIHEGTCAELDPAPLHPLTDITEPGHAAEGITGSPILVQSSVTTVDAPLADLAGGNRAINVHESAENVATYIACGDIGGSIVPGDAGDLLAIGLGEVNDSGYSGIALLQAAGEQTVVSIYLAQGLTGSGNAAMPGMDHAATPAAESVEVEISNFAYTPAEITITAGQSVTWTNLDAAPHTATARDRDVLQSGTLNEGESFTQVFDTPGTYEYFCEFHPDMKGVVIVEAP